MTAKVVHFGIRLPTATCSSEPLDAHSIMAYAQLVEDLGFESIWTLDQLITPQSHFSSPWLEPFAVLTICAAATRTVLLGTAALTVTVRNALEIAAAAMTLQRVSGGRFTLGAALGWDSNVFEAAEVPRTELGLRMDRTLGQLKSLLGDDQAFGTARDKKDIPIWIAGGSVPVGGGGIELQQPTARRIALADGWMLPAHRYPKDGLAQAISAEVDYRNAILGRERSFRIAVAQFILIEPCDVRRRTAFESLMAADRGWDEFRACYWIGDAGDIQGEILSLIDAGVDTFILTPASLRHDELREIKVELVDEVTRKLGS